MRKLKYIIVIGLISLLLNGCALIDYIYYNIEVNNNINKNNHDIDTDYHFIYEDQFTVIDLNPELSVVDYTINTFSKKVTIKSVSGFTKSNIYPISISGDYRYENELNTKEWITYNVYKNSLKNDNTDVSETLKHSYNDDEYYTTSFYRTADNKLFACVGNSSELNHSFVAISQAVGSYVVDFWYESDKPIENPEEMISMYAIHLNDD